MSPSSPGRQETRRTPRTRRSDDGADASGSPTCCWRWRAASIRTWRRCFPAGSKEIRGWRRCAAFCWSTIAPRSPRCSRSSTTRSSSPRPSAPCWPAPSRWPRPATSSSRRFLRRPWSARRRRRSARTRARWSVSSTRSSGPAIRKSIAETLDGTLQRLNQAFKHSFSWRGLKWRLEAYRSGASFADVVLKHTVVFRVEHLFLIHRKTGLLLEHVAAPEAAAQDPQMVSGMLTAIQDFVRDSFDAGQERRRAASTACGSATCCCGARKDRSRFSPPSSGATRPRRCTRSCARRSPAFTRNCAARSRRFDGDSAALGDLAMRLRGLPAATGTAAAREAALALAVGAAARAPDCRRRPGWFCVQVEEHRVDAYVQRLRDQPGVVVTGAERRDWEVARLGLARSAGRRIRPTCWPRSNLDPTRIVGHWEPLSGAEPGDRAQAPGSESQSSARGVAVAGRRAPSARAGSAPQHWVDKARALIAALPAGSPPVDLTRSQGRSGSDVRPPARRHPGARHHLRLECAEARAWPGCRARCASPAS